MTLSEFVGPHIAFAIVRSAFGVVGFLFLCTAAFLMAYACVTAFFYAIWIVSVILMRRVFSDVDSDSAKPAVPKKTLSSAEALAAAIIATADAPSPPRKRTRSRSKRRTQAAK